MADRWYETAFGAHYPLLYAHRDAQEARQCLDLLPQLAPLQPEAGTIAAAPILDLGCGDGRHLAYLLDRGLPAVGLDLSASLLACAAGRRSQSDRPPLVRGDMSRLPFREDRFFAVLSLFTAFGYFGPLQKNAGVIAEVARVLQTGGCWFLDYFDCRAVRHDLEHAENLERRRELGPVQVREVRRLSDDDRQVCKDVELVPRPGESAAAAEWGVTADGLRYTEQVALFDLAELDDLAARYGLQRIAGVGSYTGAPLGQGDRWLLVYRLDPSNENGRTP